jgi:hypothetical protein
MSFSVLNSKLGRGMIMSNPMLGKGTTVPNFLLG